MCRFAEECLLYQIIAYISDAVNEIGSAFMCRAIQGRIEQEGRLRNHSSYRLVVMVCKSAMNEAERDAAFTPIFQMRCIMQH